MGVWDYIEQGVDYAEDAGADYLKGVAADQLGVSGDDVDSFFDKAKAAVSGGGSAGDLWDAATSKAGDYLEGAAADQLGVSRGDIDSAVHTAQGVVSGGTSAGDVWDSVSHRGFDYLEGAAADRLGMSRGDIDSAVHTAQGVVGGDSGGLQGAAHTFGSFLSGAAGGAGGWRDLVPESVVHAVSEGANMPIVQDGQGVDWHSLASSYPGLNSALGSIGVSTQGVDSHVAAVANHSFDGGSAWSFGSMVADQGGQFLHQVAAPVAADHVWAGLPDAARDAGVNLPSWAGDLATHGLTTLGGHTLPDGGFVPTQAIDATDLYATHPAGDLAAADAFAHHAGDFASIQPDVMAVDHGLDAFHDAPAMPADEFADHQAAPAYDDLSAAPAVDEVPAHDQPADDYMAASDQLQSDLGDLGDDAFN
ncbi:MAG: hypothetical protein ACJ71Z_03930 [Aeromicrobium sp.]